jgi:hypothetical protein
VAPPLATRLVSLRLSSCDVCNPLLLNMLGRLASLTSLEFVGEVDPASEGWLPAGLKRLKLQGFSDGGGVGPSWLRAVGACTALEALVLNAVEVRDLQLGCGADANDFSSFLHVVNKVPARLPCFVCIQSSMCSGAIGCRRFMHVKAAPVAECI